MVAPDRVEKGSTDASGRESVRFIKNLSNGVVVVVEKEYKNSPDDMETINIWADLSSEAINAQQKAAPGIHVQNAILDIDVAKIRKDAEEAIRADVEYLQKQANATPGEQNKRSFSITAEQIQEMTGGKLNSSNYGKVSNAINPIGRFLYSRRESEYAPYRTVIPVPTLDDYYIATETTFTAMEGGAKEWEKMKESGKYELQQSPKSGSEYLIDRETGDIFRFSDHWGTVASCRWELEGGKNEGTYEIGKSNIQDFDAHLPSYSGGYVAKNPKFEQFVDEYRNILDVTTQNYRTLLDSGIEIGKAEKKKIDAAIAQQDWLRKSLEKSNWMPRYNEIKYSLPARPATPKRNEGEGIMAYAERVARVLKAQRAWDRKHKDSVEGMKDIEKMLEEMDADGVIADKKAIAQLYARYEAAKARAKENRRKHGAELREARKKLNALVKKQGNAQDKIADLLERYENWKTLRDKVRSALDNKNLSSINKSTLMAMLKAMGTATEANTEELSEMDAILAEIEIKTAKTEISEMLDEKRRKLNSKGMAVGKGVDLDTQKVLDMTKKNLSDLTTDKMQEEITKLRSENWHLRRDQEGEYADMAEEQKQERIAQNNEKIRKLREDLETELRSRSTKTVEEVEAELRELTGREEEWDERDYLVYEALQFKKQMADFNEAEKAAIEFEHEIDKKAAEASDLYRQMRQSGISNEEKEDLKQKYSEAKRIIAAMQQSLIEQKQIQAEKTKSFADNTYFIFIKKLNRFHKTFELHILRKTTNVMMRFNAITLNYIRINCALSKK
jgi:hypothetical protein